ncbi:nucleotidyltransferase domain-containing protein [Proteiniborus sp. MB09-C3]|uniref:nucleotidyltransferase domain-containing protein n=1 Tax=Proteiniborus sp. MB09-C3 TaxID=3050072 RepID=UPI002554E956|nr:nucleotidyltransferase domain-containing protein [Proteiniborus sp. MB09-C3]WIV13447.1 nucleotidyltransferase domain-containing protein [Proteiniborus sp. MB09-C3]
MYDIELLKNRELISLLEDLKNVLIDIYGNNLKDIILYGSYARGDNDSESDIDIMILVDLDNDEQRKYRKTLVEKITDLSIHYDVVISVIESNYKDFNNRISYVPFYKNVVREGIKVYANR